MKREQSKHQLLSWIDRNVPTQCEWAVNYLTNHGFGQIERVDSRIFLALAEEDLRKYKYSKPDTITLLIKKMRAAWNAKKNRDKSRGRKAYSYVMSTDIEKKLRLLAGKNLINTTLEDIINREYNLQVDEKILFNLNVRQENDNRDKLLNKIDAITKELDNIKHLLEVEKATFKLQQDSIKDLLMKICMQDITLQHLQHLQHPVHQLSTIEESEIIKNRDTRFEFFNDKLKADLASLGYRRRFK